MRKIGRYLVLISLTLVSCAVIGRCDIRTEELKKAKSPVNIEAKIVRRLAIDKGYHEGLYWDGANIWVANGRVPKGTDGRIWVVDISSGRRVRDLKPIASFTEGVASLPNGELFSTDWETKKLYRFRVENEVAVQDGLEISFAPSHPAGVVCAKDALYVLTWTRGLGTRFDILEIARDGGIVRKVAIKDIQEPSQMAWDGKYLWITSWFHQRVYKVDMDRLEIVGSFKSPVKRSTGIAWDGKYMWLTGTSSDLYQLEISHGKDEMEIIVKSPAFKDGEEMAVKYGYRDENVSPPLEWSGLPANTKSLAVICDDPDAVGGDWTHWLIFNIPPSVKSLAEGVRSDKTLSDGSSQGVNDYREIGYGGPCPPSGIHRYVFAVYALDKTLDLSSGGSKKALLEAMKGHILGRGQIIGRFRHR